MPVCNTSKAVGIHNPRKLYVHSKTLLAIKIRMYKENLCVTTSCLALVSCILIGPLQSLYSNIYFIKNLLCHFCWLFAGWQKVPIVANHLLLYKSSFTFLLFLAIFWFTELSKWQFYWPQSCQKWQMNMCIAISLGLKCLPIKEQSPISLTSMHWVSLHIP